MRSKPTNHLIHHRPMQRIILLIALVAMATIAGAQENCANGIDDDGDGLIDLQDTECSCYGLHPWTPADQLPNPSFEEKLCCPVGFSQTNCLLDWDRGTTATADYLHTCGFVSASFIDAGLVPFPNDSGAVALIISDSWSEYIATCTTSPLLAGRPYRLTFEVASVPTTNFGDLCNNGDIFYPELDLAIWGHPECTGEINTKGCPSEGDSTWQILGSVTYVPESAWKRYTITFIPPEDIRGVMIGRTCDLPDTGYSGSPCYAYFALDDLELDTAEQLDTIQISDNGWTEPDQYALSAEVNDSGGTWQWYLDGIALEGQESAQLYFSDANYQPGTYQVVYTQGGHCLQDSFLIDLPPPRALADLLMIHGDTLFLENRSEHALEWIWHFGDGTTSMEEYPFVHVYPGPGLYEGYLVAINHCCTDTFFFTVPIFQPPFLVDSMMLPFICDSLGSILLDILSSTPYTCEWNTGWMSDDPSITGLPPGLYSVKVTNQNGQSTFGPFTIDSLTLGFQGIMDILTVPTCGLPPSGSILLTPAGPDTVYQYQWSHDPLLEISLAEELPGGEYTVTITDAFGCRKAFAVTLPEWGPVIDSLVITPPQCPGDSSGTLDVWINGLQPPFDTEVLNIFTSETKSPPYQLDRGDYLIQVTDSLGCQTHLDFEVIDPPAMKIDFLIGLDLDGQPTILSPKISQGQPPYSFLWSDGSTAPTRSDLGPGIYQLTVTDGLGCIRTKEFKYGIPGGGVIGNGGLQIEPVPGTAQVRIDRIPGQTAPWTILIVDVYGRIIQTRLFPQDMGSLTCTLPFAGVYWVQAIRADGFRQSRMVLYP
ncbi:MAG: PKD domain-containing protein [Saprospiraceae bacterium]|nr:PKD domain-containing protein [Saprospiraceae bacterium]